MAESTQSSLPWASVVGTGLVVVFGGAVVVGAEDFSVVLAGPLVLAGGLVLAVVLAGLSLVVVVAGGFRVVWAGGVVLRSGAGADSIGFDSPFVALDPLVVVSELVDPATDVDFDLVILPADETELFEPAVLDAEVADLPDEVSDASTPVRPAEDVSEPATPEPAVSDPVLFGVVPPALLATIQTRPTNTMTATAITSERRSQYTFGGRGPTGFITTSTVASHHG